jgi:hypothetical protein
MLVSSILFRLNDIPVSWTFPGLLFIVVLAFLFFAATFSTQSPIDEWHGVILPAHFLVINTTCWNGFIVTSIWQGGETVFRFEFTPDLSACSFYGGLIFIGIGMGFLVKFFARLRQYSLRQRVLFPLSVMTIIIGVVVSLRTPVEFQKLIDSIELPQSKNGEQDVPSDGHKPSSHSSSTDPTAPADAH